MYFKKYTYKEERIKNQTLIFFFHELIDNSSNPNNVLITPVMLLFTKWHVCRVY